MKQYIVTKPILNIRNSPSIANDENFVGQAMQGETLYLTGEIIKGDTPAGGNSADWLMDNLNRVVASEGVGLHDFNLKSQQFAADTTLSNIHFGSTDPSKWLVNWGFVDREIWKVWEDFKTRGKNARVAVIDTGAIWDSNDLKGKINQQLCIGIDSSVIDIDDPTFHGTMSAGLIAANGQNVQQVVGIAPDCELVIYRLFNNNDLDGYTNENLSAMLQAARRNKVDIINMSFCRQDDMTALAGEIKACLDQNILLVASVGDENQNQGLIQNYPSSFQGCISVGAYQLSQALPAVYTAHSAQSSNLLCLAPGDNLKTTGSNSQPAFHTYTSAASAFMAGILALLVAHLKDMDKAISAADIYTNITKACTKIGDNAEKDTVEGCGVINPYQLFTLSL